MLVTNKGSYILDALGVAGLTAPKLILLDRASAVPARTDNFVSDLTEYSGGGYTGGFGGSSRKALTPSVSEDDTNFRSEITNAAVTFSGVTGPAPIAPIAAFIDSITSNAASPIIAFIPIKATAAALVPTAATAANPSQITFGSAHGLTTNDLVYLEGFAGGTWAAGVNGKVYKVTVVDATNITLQGLDATGFGTATLGTAVVYRPLAMNGADVTVTPNTEGLIQSRTNVGAV